MPAEIVDKWFSSKRSALICQRRMRPLEHPILKGKPFSSQKGQAEAFFLKEDNGTIWILKKFRHDCMLNRDYLARIAGLLPGEQGFLCGTQRTILAAQDLTKSGSCYHCRPFAQWLEDTVLMPKVSGCDWGTLADDLRDGSLTLDEAQRQTWCSTLCNLVVALEKARCSHRDLSCGNVFLDLDTGTVYLIDFDSLFHPGLTMPVATTCGTAGYTAPYAWHGGNPDPRRTWCEGADRYALALLLTEILITVPGMDATGEGGLFDQNELRKRSGPGITAVLNRLQTKNPQAATLLQQTLASHHFGECPTPTQWNDLLGGCNQRSWVVPDLKDLCGPWSNDIAGILRQRRAPAPIRPTPGLDTMPKITICKPTLPQPIPVNWPVHP